MPLTLSFVELQVVTEPLIQPQHFANLTQTFRNYLLGTNVCLFPFPFFSPRFATDPPASLVTGVFSVPRSLVLPGGTGGCARHLPLY